MDIGIVGPSYPAQSITQDDQECINWRAEIDPTLPEGRNVIALYPTPGLTILAEFPNQAEIRGLRSLSAANPMLLTVCGNLVYVSDQTYNTDYVVGELNSSTGPVSITDNGTYAYITDGSYRYCWFINNEPRASFLATITGAMLNVTQIFSTTPIALDMKVVASSLPYGIVITSFSTGTGGVGTYNLNQSVPFVGPAIRMTGDTAASIVNNSYLSGDRLYASEVMGDITGTLRIGQNIIGTGATANTIITQTNTENTALSGIGKGGTYTISNPVPNGTLTGANRIAAGTGYISLPTVNVPPPANAAGEQAIITIDKLTVVSTSIVTAGSGYVVGEALTAVNGKFLTSAAQFTVSAVNATGGVTALLIVNGGDYTVIPTNPDALFNNNSVGSGLTVNLTYGIGTTFTVVAPGSGYLQIPIPVTITGGGGTGAQISATNGPAVINTAYYGFDFTQMPVTDGAFSGGISCEVIDNLFIYAEPAGQRWAASDPLSPITQGLSFSLKDGTPDDIVAIASNNREVFVLGQRNMEVWVDIGSFPFAFQRIPGASSQQGCAATYSVARLGNSIAYLSRNLRGEGQIVQLEGYVPKRISNHAVEFSINNQYIEDAIAFTYQLSGHEVYVISFPTIDLTWAYDLATGLWHKWMSWDNSTATFRRQRVHSSTQFGSKTIVGDYENGKLYEVDTNNFTDDDVPVHRLRRVRHIVSDYKQQYFSSLQIYFQPGVGTQTLGRDPQAILRWSNDGGFTWQKEKWQSVGTVGKYRQRAIWRRLGRARDRVYELRVTDPVNWVVISSELTGDEGDH